MRLSEAIRLGSMMTPQAFGVQVGRRLVKGYRGWLFWHSEPTTCAFGAALHAHPCPIRPGKSGGIALRGVAIPAGTETAVTELPYEWMSVIWSERSCPACQGFPVHVFNLISHLNDTHRWTREQIADFVATVELPQAVPAVEPIGELAELRVTTRVVLPI